MFPSYPTERLEYDLPQDLIAQEPPLNRAESRLLLVDCNKGNLEDCQFRELPDLLPPNSLVVLNDTKVVPARLYGKRPVSGSGQGGGKVEVLLHRWNQDNTYEAIVGSSGSLPAGSVVELPGGWTCRLQGPKSLDGVAVEFLDASGNLAALGELLSYLNVHGETPLPPYIKRRRNSDAAHRQSDYERYQTVYASKPGSVAAPTAGLHFDTDMLGSLANAGFEIASVTLHVGLGTFAPVTTADLADHRMHGELYSVSRDAFWVYSNARQMNRKVLAVGTTSLRVLHTLERSGLFDTRKDIAGETHAFIYPGLGTESAEILLTNFHLPKSTLLALVYAFGGEELLREAYRHAIEKRYRFFSYGDCMLIRR